MCPRLTAAAFIILIAFAPQNPLLENQAITRVQQTLASRFEPGLPERAFSVWVRQVIGAEAGVAWHLTECGEQKNAAGETDIQACVEMSALREDGRKVVIFTHVGGFRKGLTAIPKIQFAVIEHRGELYEVPRLRDLSLMLRSPLVKKPRAARTRPVALPPAHEKKPSVLPSLPRVSDNRILSGGEANEAGGKTAEPPARALRRVSEGVLIGSAVNKFVPNYPPVAKQLKVEGEVKVEIVISEDGRVTESKAISGPDILRTSAEDAALKWIFKPTLLNNVPVKIQGVLTFVFTRP